jgi:hypothetical protein
MHKKRAAVLVIVCILLFSSCTDLFSWLSGQAEYTAVVFYDEELSNNRPGGSFVADRTIISDEENFYGLSCGSRDDPGLLIRIPKDGSAVTEIAIQPAAAAKGYTNSVAYWPWDITIHDDDIVVTAIEGTLCLGIELLCFDRTSLELKWFRKITKESRIPYGTPTWWDGYYLYPYNNTDTDCMILVLDTDGNEVVARNFAGGSITVDGELLAVNGLLYVRHAKKPLAIYDLKKVCNPAVADSSCLVFDTQTTNGNPIWTSIVADDSRYYLSVCNPDIEPVEAYIEARLFTDNSVVWRRELDSGFDCVEGPLTVYNGKLFGKR